MIKTVEQLKAQAKKKYITFYLVNVCSICEYPCGYCIKGDRVFYDRGCDCVPYSDVQERSWEALAETYNANQPENNPEISKEFLDELNQIWQF